MKSIIKIIKKKINEYINIMEYLLAGTVVGAGYLLGKNGKNERQINIKNIEQVDPSEKNIYESLHSRNAKESETKIVDKRFQKSKNAIETNIIPPQFNNRIINYQSNPIKYLQKPNNIRSKMSKKNKDIYVSTLSGKLMTNDEFTHNNMTPFFGGSVRQNTYEYANQPILELFTGSDKLITSKSESEPFFKPTKDINNVYGTQLSTQKLVNRYLPSQKKTNETPTEKLIVGPGLNAGYTNKPSGGFNQTNTRDFIMPKGVDELRTLTNPKLTYKGRVISGKAINQNPGKMGKLYKNNPDTFSIWGPDRYFTTVGAITKEKKKPCIIMPDTNRKISRQHIGPGAPATKKNQKTRSKYRKSTKNIYETSGPRNIGAAEKWSNNEFSDYGKKAINLPSNERDITGTRTHVSNVTSIVKAIVAPITDLFRTTRKENVEGNPRQSGNINVARPKNHTARDPNDIARTTIKETNIHDTRTGNLSGKTRLTVYDPNDIARTTIKETNIHDTRTGNMGARERGFVYDPNDIARTTIKETNIHDVRTGNMGARGRGQVYDPNDIARTTIKETNIHDTRTGYMEGRDRGFVYDPNDIARTTIKETNIHDTRTGNMGARGRGQVHDPNDIARTTIKETNIHDVRTGNMGARGRGQIYDPNDIARTTIKETNIQDTRTGYMQSTTSNRGFVIDKDSASAKVTIRNTTNPEETVLNMGARDRGFVYDPNDIARTTIKETNIHDNRSGNMGARDRGFVYDPNDIAKTTIKETNIEMNRTGNIGTLEGDKGGYLTNPKEAPNTNRQFQSDEYTGNMAADNSGGSGYLTNKNEAPNTNRQFSSVDYTGSADSMNNKPMSYSDVYNMTLNEVREGTLKGRAPTTSNVSVPNGSDSVNIEMKKLEGDYINSRELSTTKVYNSIKEIKNCSVTTYKDQLNNKKIADRIAPETLNAFRQNPYSQPLDSHVFS